jgi:hypothetical protein
MVHLETASRYSFVLFVHVLEFTSSSLSAPPSSHWLAGWRRKEGGREGGKERKRRSVYAAETNKTNVKNRNR